MWIFKKLFSSSQLIAMNCGKLSWKFCLKLKPYNLHRMTQTLQYSGRFTLLKEPIDPKVLKLKDKIIYSEYIETKMYKLRYEKLKQIECDMNFKINIKKVQEELHNPPISVALKYLNNATSIDVLNEPVNKSDNTLENNTVKPIYMPYAAQDIVNDLEDSVRNDKELDKESEEEMYEDNDNSISENYMEQYEKCVEESKMQENYKFTQWRDDIQSIPPNWMMDYSVFDETKLDMEKDDPWVMRYGTPEPNSEVTSIPCGGCGALLHCKDPAIPGYIPSELFIYKNINELKTFSCQRCHFMKNYNVALDVKVSSDDYPKLLEKIKLDQIKAAILVVDLTDFPCCIWPDLHQIIGRNIPIFLVGNKIDLLPQDCTNFFTHVTERLTESVINFGINKQNIIGTSLISAKTHFGIEELITKLFSIKRKGNIYLIGCTNVGKSSLFNALLLSDYCKVKAKDLVQRATVAPWPGTTLNLLKFPITRLRSTIVSKRVGRLIEEQQIRSLERQHLMEQYKKTRNIKFATLQSRIGQTYINYVKGVRNNNTINDIFKISKQEDTIVDKQKFGLNENDFEFKNSNWCFDTPGTIQPDQILHLLTTEELMNTLPKRLIMPRSFVIHANETIFLAGIGRIDILHTDGILRITVFASDKLPVTICSTDDANYLYNQLLRTEAFVVPIPDEDRLKLWPELKSLDFNICGIDKSTSTADVILSSAGWVAFTPFLNENVHFRAWTPEGRGIYLRQPALLKKSISLRGRRVSKTPMYKKTKIVFGKY